MDPSGVSACQEVVSSLSYEVLEGLIFCFVRFPVCLLFKWVKTVGVRFVRSCHIVFDT